MKKIKVPKLSPDDIKRHISDIGEKGEDAPRSADGLDAAIIGIAERYGVAPVLAYDYDKAIDILIKESNMSEEEALEYFDVNVIGSWVGKGTPIFVTVIRDAHQKEKEEKAPLKSKREIFVK